MNARDDTGIDGKIDRPHAFLPALLLAVLMLGAYYPATNAGFIWDDDEHFTTDQLLAQPDALYYIWCDPIGTAWNYWPISRTSFLIEHRLWGINARASHIVNILLHLAGVMILYFGLRRFRVPHPWFIAALFALHPIFAESVSWITERKNVLSGVFYLASIWAFLHFDEIRKRRWYFAALLLFVCALLSKSSTIMLPVILILCRLALRRPWQRSDYLLLIPFFLLSLTSGLTSIYFEEHRLGSTGPGFDQSLAERIAIAGRIPFFYLWKILLPVPLMFVYPRWDIDAGNLLHYLPAVALVILSLLFLRCYKSWGRLPFLVLAAFGATLFPVLGFFDIYGMRFSYVADHWVYLPALPILLLIGIGLGNFLKKSDQLRTISFAAIILVCTMLTWRHNHIFKDPDTLWKDTIARNPDCFMAHNNLGVVMMNRGEVEQAATHFQAAIAIKPNYPEALNNYGSAFFAQGQIDAAIHHLSEAIRIDPQYADAQVNLGIMLSSQGRIGAATEHYQAVLRLNPSHIAALYNLANARLAQERTDEAIVLFRDILRLEPGHFGARNNLGGALLSKNELTAAAGQFREALRLDPTNANAHNNLGETLRRLGDLEKAVFQFREAIRLDPGIESAKANLKETLLQLNQAK